MWLSLRLLSPVRKLDDWSFKNWRWIMFGCQVCISLLTLCFCFGMIGTYRGDAQKSYWPIVTIIIGYFMPNAGNWYEQAKKESLQRAAWAARALARENKQLQQQLEQSSNGQPSATAPGSSTPSAKQYPARRQSHRTFYAAQVVVAVSIMVFCMSQLVSSQNQKAKCMQVRQNATRAVDTLLALQGSGVNITKSTLVEVLAGAVPVTPPATPTPEPALPPTTSNLTLFSALANAAQKNAQPVQLTAAAAATAATQATLTCDVPPTAAWNIQSYHDNSTALQEALATAVANPATCNATDASTPCFQCTRAMAPGTYTLTASTTGATGAEELTCTWKCFDSSIAGATLQILSSNQLELQANTSIACICTPSQGASQAVQGRRRLFLLTAAPTATAAATSRKLLQGAGASSSEPAAGGSGPSAASATASSNSSSAAAANGAMENACTDSTKETEGVYLPILTAINGFFMPKQPDRLGEEEEEDEEDEGKGKEDERKKAEDKDTQPGGSDTQQGSDQGRQTATAAQ